MKRTKKNSGPPDAILTSDWHLREDQPICRTDDFVKSQWTKVAEVKRLQKKHNCPVIHAGDLFHHWKASPYLITKCITDLPDQFYTVYGQHDLPQNTMDLAWKSGVNTLKQAGRLAVLEDGNWGQVPEKGISIGNRKVGVWHHLTYITKPFPGASDGMAEAILKKYKDFDVMLTGDNHQQFVTERDGRVLVNPGPLTRQKADEINHQPSVYFYYAKSNTVQSHKLPFDDQAVSRQHVDDKEERNERIEAFINKINDEWETSLDFNENLKRFFVSNKTSKQVRTIITKALEEEQ